MWTVYLLLLLLAAVLFLVGRIVVRALWRGGAAGRATLAVGLLLAAWAGYRALVPSEAAYLDEFARLSGVRLPESLQMIERDASFPNQRGEYAACFIARLPAAAIPALQARLGPSVAATNVTPCRPHGEAYAFGMALLRYDIPVREEQGRLALTLDPAGGWIKAEWQVRKQLLKATVPQ